jgi:hypothetical protein
MIGITSRLAILFGLVFLLFPCEGEDSAIKLGVICMVCFAGRFPNMTFCGPARDTVLTNR